ncbi:MAG: sugar transferase [Phycisphaerae bacterium]|nr:sugar transferase [Saprospiraceae bacterium]
MSARKRLYPFVKRAFDLLAAFAVLILLLPLWLPILMILRITGEGEVFYLQKRIGLKSQPFSIWKFATMLKNSPNMGTGTITLRNDPRVTPFGHFLRKSKINELPQIINVLMGDMSFIGPRPLDEKGYLSYPADIRKQIYWVKPGISGIGSIVFRDEEQLISASRLPPREFYTQYIAPYKAALELWYQAHQSFFTDFVLLWLTVWVVLFPKSQIIHQVFPTLPEKPSTL